MNKYKVYTAGFPESKKVIYANTPLEAAKSFFMDNKFKNSIVVKWGWFGSKLIQFKELQSLIHSSDLDKIEFKEDKGKFSYWKNKALEEIWTLEFLSGKYVFSNENCKRTIHTKTNELSISHKGL